MKAKAKALAAARAASDKKALDIVIINMRKMSSVCDFFLIASGGSTTQVRAIADNIAKELRKKGQRLKSSEGVRESLWILLDYGDVVAHVFLNETRRYYNLERLWADAPQEKFEEPAMVKVKRKKPAPRKPPRKRKKTKRRIKKRYN